MDYTKQERFKPLENSSEILQNKTVAIVGLGGLGSHSSEYLARMGIGHLVLIDDDIIEESNLSRQGLFTHHDSVCQRAKGEVIKDCLEEINPTINITFYDARFTKELAPVLLKGVDLVLDGSDNLATRYLINDYCFRVGIPWIYTSATASMGTMINFIPGKTPCFRCVFGEVAEDNASCDRDGVILPVLTMITSFQVTEALKILLDKEPSLEELRYNIWTRNEHSLPISIFDNPTCSCKQQKKSPHTNTQDLYLICSGDTVQANTRWNLLKIANKFESWGFSIKQQNESIIETIKEGNQRIVGFKTGKIIFHHMSKEEVKCLL